MIQIKELKKDGTELEIDRIKLKKINHAILKNLYNQYKKDTLIVINLSNKDTWYIGKNTNGNLDIMKI